MEPLNENDLCVFVDRWLGPPQTILTYGEVSCLDPYLALDQKDGYKKESFRDPKKRTWQKKLENHQF